jgi:hypothetical protein
MGSRKPTPATASCVMLHQQRSLALGDEFVHAPRNFLALIICR